MLGKLIKHEFRATGRIMLPLLGAELLLSVLAGLSVRGLDRIEDMGFLGMSYVTTLVVFILGLFALWVVAFVLMIQRFYKNLLRDEGYITMTLPASVDAQIWAKLLVSFVWFVAVAVIIVITILILASIGTRGNLLQILGFDAQRREILREGIAQVGGGNIALFALEYLLFSFIGSCAGCLLWYSAMAIGHSAADHKMLLSFVAFFVIYIALNTITSGLLFGVLPKLDLDRLMASLDSIEGLLRFYHNYLRIGSGVGLLYDAVFYFVTRYFLKNKLNLA